MFLTTEIVKEWENCTLFQKKSWIHACPLMEWWLPYRAILSNIISWSKMSISKDMLSCILGKMWFAYIYGAYREKAMATHSSTLAWKILWMEEPGRLQSMGSRRVGHDWVTSPSLLCTGEGNDNPLQCSCLENPRDGGAWWTAVCGVAQSRTRLKRLSSGSNMEPTGLPWGVSGWRICL